MTQIIVGACPKCGEPDPAIKYRDGTELDCPDRLHGFGDHFHALCTRCGYSWGVRVEDESIRIATAIGAR